VTVWLAAAGALLVGLVPCGLVALRAPIADAVVALELAGTVTTLALVALSMGAGRSSYLVLPMVLAIMTIVGGLLIVRVTGDRWR
jgi:multisubunit Na+/H+ antiporter MnhF subunit